MITQISSFWKWNIGERMVVYLAMSDASMCISHMLDHAWIYHTHQFPPDAVCTVFSFILQVLDFHLLFFLLLLLETVL